MKRLVILGGGESGVGTAILGKSKGFDVFVSDFGTISDHYLSILNNYQIDFEHQKHTEDLILNADVVMKSPGIPDKVAIVQKLLIKNIPVISEIEFAYPYTDATIIGITGSNGKTTTSSLTYHILKSAGLNVAIGGNIGKSFAWQVAENDYDYYVLEISSFQLDGIVNFKPHIAIITNITPDHLDRYEYKFENYIESKFKITKNQTEKDYLIIDNDDEVILKYLENNTIKAQLLTFAINNKNSNAKLNKNIMEITINEESYNLDVQEFSIQGNHNYKNASSASMTASLVNIRKETIRKSLMEFLPIPHRYQTIRIINGVKYINDSKATNVNSVYYALNSTKAPVILIIGGEDKGNDYDEIMSLVREKVKALICLGKDNEKLLDTFSDVLDNIFEVKSMKEAVQISKKITENGDTVLLSPACASFDLFKNYEDRGNQFIDEVMKLG
jgi:UDP-N-acetylmuramoylalanine--D-glutamate ligase